jgi:hypothetical protein
MLIRLPECNKLTRDQIIAVRNSDCNPHLKFIPADRNKQFKSKFLILGFIPQNLKTFNCDDISLKK